MVPSSCAFCQPASSLLWSTEINHFICLRPSTSCLTPFLALFHPLNCSSYHWPSGINPFPVFLSSFLSCIEQRLSLQKHFGVKGISLAIPQLFRHTHTCADGQSKIYTDVISADLAIDRQQYSRENRFGFIIVNVCQRGGSYNMWQK